MRDVGVAAQAPWHVGAGWQRTRSAGLGAGARARRLPRFLALLAGVGAGLWAGELCAASAAERPNVVVFLVDDMGVMDTSTPFLTDAAGRPQRYPLNAFYRTPAMERLAARGVRFSQFYAMSVCSPSRVSLMTGQIAARHRVTNWINPDQNNAGPLGPPAWNWHGLDADDVTLARLLQQAGYRTIHVGKGHFGPRQSVGADPRRLGFDENVGGASFGHPGSYYGEKDYGNSGPDARHAVPHLEAYHGSDVFLTEALTREAKTRVAQAVAADQPFFLYLAHYAVHAPFESDPRFAADYRDSGQTGPAQAFATLIAGMDRSLGDLLDHLETLGVAENTLVLFLGDNGTDAPLGHEHAVACAAPLRGKKGAHYEGGMRVPFIASWARPQSDHLAQQRTPIASGAVQTHVAAIYDLFPTVLHAADVAPPAGHVVDGDSLVPLLTGAPAPERPAKFLMHYPHAVHRSDYWTSYRDGPWKVIYHYQPETAPPQPRYELFHLEDDPFEQRDLAAERPDELQRMMQGLVAALDACDAQFPLSKTDRRPLKPVIP